jgi:hypothetical protein
MCCLSLGVPSALSLMSGTDPDVPFYVHLQIPSLAEMVEVQYCLALRRLDLALEIRDR